MKKIFFLIIIATVFITPQRDDKPIQPQINLFSNNGVISFPANDSASTCYYLCTIPYRILVFEKEGKDYVSNFRLQVEIYSDNKLIKRELKNRSIKTEKFDITTDKNIYQNNLFELELPFGQYEFRTTLSDLNSDREIKLKPELITTDRSPDEVILFPIVVREQVTKCSDGNSYHLIENFNGSIPFSPEKYSMIIPVTDTSVGKLSLKMTTENDSIFSFVTDESFIMSLSAGTCDEKITLMQKENKIVTRNFVVRNINKLLYEGTVEIDIIAEEQSYEREFGLPVVWIDKPFSLFDSEQAINFLEFIENDDLINELLSEDEKDYGEVLIDYWKKFDPDPESSFNPLMQEYYERIDYADQEFRGLGRDSGIKSDRGKIYIRFGKPNEITRSSNADGNIVETWSYLNPERKFSFVDVRGTGNFTLVEG